MIKELTKYGIVKNSSGELMIMFEVDSSPVEKPIFYYNGGDNATLVKSKDNTIQFNNVNNGVKEDLMKATKILVVEVNDGSVLNEYTAIVRHEV